MVLLLVAGRPSAASQQKVLQQNGWDYASFGAAGVALAGDWAAVGQPYFTGPPYGPPWGTVQVYRKSPTRWDLHQVLAWPEDYTPNTYGPDFGRDIAIAGDYMVIGSPGSGLLWEGRAYVYRLVQGQWTLLAKLAAHDAVTFGGFGAGVDIRVKGDPVAIEVLVGSPGDDDRGPSSGSAYLFRKVETYTAQPFAEVQKVTPADGAIDFRFGHSVAIAATRDLFIVGCHEATNGSGANTGAAYVFTPQPGGWAQTRKLLPPDGAADDRFGYAVDVTDDVAAVSAYLHDAHGLINAGAVYMYDLRAAGWPLEKKLEPAWGSIFGDYFGQDVSLSGERLLTSSYAHDVDGVEWVGALQLFTRQAGTWEEQVILPRYPAAYLSFGYSLALSGDRMVAGAFRDDNGSGIDAGAAYLLFPPYETTQP